MYRRGNNRCKSPFAPSLDQVPFGKGSLDVDTEHCLRDANNFKEPGVKTTRVYMVDNSKDHDECMKAMAEAGITSSTDAKITYSRLDVVVGSADSGISRVVPAACLQRFQELSCWRRLLGVQLSCCRDGCASGMMVGAAFKASNGKTGIVARRLIARDVRHELEPTIPRDYKNNTAVIRLSSPHRASMSRAADWS